MKIPKLFKPESGLDEKTEQLLKKEKLILDSDELRQKLFDKLQFYLEQREEGWNGPFYISDQSKENRYEYVKGVINNVMADLHAFERGYKWELFDHYKKRSSDDLSTKLYHKLIWIRSDDDFLIYLFYTSNNITKRIMKDEIKKSMLLNKAMVTTIK